MDSSNISFWNLPPAEEENSPFLLNFTDSCDLSGLLESIAPRNETETSIEIQAAAKRCVTPHSEVKDCWKRRKKRSRTKIHNLCEKKRRDNIKARMKVLQELIPNSQKLDKASLLDKTISHIQSLQGQLQIMQFLNPFFNPLALQFVTAPNLPGFPSSNFVSMSGLPPTPYFQFPVSSCYMGLQIPAFFAHASSNGETEPSLLCETDGSKKSSSSNKGVTKF